MSDPVARLNAALEGRYAIERELGKGGMATVYVADDLKHERKVALKVLKPELAAVVGADRFLAEIKTTANLQHPHVLPLFDSGEASSVNANPHSRRTVVGWPMSRPNRAEKRSTCAPFRTRTRAGGWYPRMEESSRCGHTAGGNCSTGTGPTNWSPSR